MRSGRTIKVISKILIPVVILLVTTGGTVEENVFSLDESPPDIVWITLPEGWEELAGLTVGICGSELILFFPKDELKSPDIDEADWPPRFVFHIDDRDGRNPPKDFEDTFYLEFSALLDRITLRKLDGRWEGTLYMHRPLRSNIEEADTYARITVEFLGTWLDVAAEGEGWRIWEVNRFLPSGAQRAFITQLNTTNPATEVRISTASQYGASNLMVDEYVRNSGAIGGVNGGYFYNKNILGLVVIRGEMVSLPMLSRPVFALDEKGVPYIGHINVICEASIGDRDPLHIDTINDYPRTGPVLLTPNHPSRVRGDFKGLKVVIGDNVIEYITSDDIEKLEGKTVIWDPSGSSGVLKQLSPGEVVDFQFSTSGFPFVPYWALQAGPILVEDGRISDPGRGSFMPNITNGRSPRTAVALTINGELLLFFGEGRMSIHSLGFSLEELAQLLIETGAYTAMNLDGGASSSMFTNGRYWGLTASRVQKSIPNAIVFGGFSRLTESTGSF